MPITLSHLRLTRDMTYTEIKQQRNILRNIDLVFLYLFNNPSSNLLNMTRRVCANSLIIILFESSFHNNVGWVGWGYHPLSLEFS